MENQLWAGIVQGFLPPGAQIIKLMNPQNVLAIKWDDMDGDMLPEIAVGYRLHGEIHVLLLKKYNNLWYRIADFREPGYSISFIGFKDITGDGKSDLIVGYQEGAIWSKLYIYTLVGTNLYKIVDGIPYSMMEIVDMPKEGHTTARSRIALWVHDTGDAYKVELLVWSGNTLVSDKNSYKYYFKKVMAYYTQKTNEMPDAAFYWYYLADAQIKAGLPVEAIASIEKGLKLNAQYPSKDEFIKLRVQAEEMPKSRYNAPYPISVNTIDGVKWGYMNDKGEVVIDPKYDMAGQFQNNGLAVVSVKNLSGLIDTNGRYVVEPKYLNIDAFSEGRATAIDNNGFTVIDEAGKEIFKSKNYIGNFVDGRAVYSEEGEKWLYGYIDSLRKKVIPAIYETAGDFVAGKAVVGFNGGGYGIIDVNGKVLRKFNLAYVGNISEGLLPFKKSNDGNYGFMDEAGNVIIQPAYSGVDRFKDGRAVVNISPDYGNLFGLIDMKGNYIIRPQYNDIKVLGEGLYAVGTAIDKDNPLAGSKYAIADTNGKFLTDFLYYGVSEYKNGIASAYDNFSTFFIDKTGKKVSTLPSLGGSGTLEFIGDLIRADIDRRVSYINKDGRVIWQQNTKIPVGGKYSISVLKYRTNRNYLVYYPQISGMSDPAVQATVNVRLKNIAITDKVDESTEMDYSYESDFSVEYYNKDLLVLKFEGYNYPFGAAHGMPRKDFAHLDLTSGRFFTLKDLFKSNSNYVKVLSDIIRKQIEKQGSDSFVWLDSYSGIKENQPFYINKNGLNIYFYPYDIAPYAAGFPTFTIKFSEIEDIIDTKGSFWKAFN